MIRRIAKSLPLHYMRWSIWRHIHCCGAEPAMKVVLTRKLANRIDGVDVTDCEVGDVLDLPIRDARLLLAEQWATPDRRHSHGPPTAFERRGPVRGIGPPGDAYRKAS